MTNIIQFPVRILTTAEIITKHNARILKLRLGKKAPIINYNYFLQKKFKQQADKIYNKKDDNP